jgi:hypothetical protein
MPAAVARGCAVAIAAAGGLAASANEQCKKKSAARIIERIITSQIVNVFTRSVATW